MGVAVFPEGHQGGFYHLGHANFGGGGVQRVEVGAGESGLCLERHSGQVAGGDLEEGTGVGYGRHGEADQEAVVQRA